MKDILGNRYGRLVVIEPTYQKNNSQYLWKCLCDCGVEKILKGGELRYGKIRSCGCLMREAIIKASTTHGMKNTRFYATWERMKAKCNNKNLPDYPYYGGRGIKVCKRWNRFQNFRDDMYQSYLGHVKKFGESNTTIDRINVNKNYAPENCKWSTRKEQGNNKRNNIIVNWKDKKMTLKQATELTGVNYRKAHRRLIDHKWSVEKALNPL